ncbi:MAG: hypothetical protein QOI13_681 [Paraburkholderia sp.]|nr:hypothetical protein [Paraburkholderia sp.]
MGLYTEFARPSLLWRILRFASSALKLNYSHLREKFAALDYTGKEISHYNLAIPSPVSSCP